MLPTFGLFVAGLMTFSGAATLQAGTDHSSKPEQSVEQSIEQAKQEESSSSQDVERAGAASNHLDFAGLKAKCQELSSNQQLKPFKAIVTCRDVKYIWREVGQHKQPLNNYREIGAAIRMKGFETPNSQQSVGIEPSQYTCLDFERFKITVPSVDAELSCDDLNAIDDLTKYCLEQVNLRASDDPSQVIEESTGERQTTCNSAPSKVSKY